MSASTWSTLKDKFRTSERCVEASCRDKSASAGISDEVEPPDRAELGRAAWRYLHSLAAHHPEQASATEQSDSVAWLASFVQFYPCSHCAEHFVGVCEASPPQVASRQEYSVWWCEAHNRVSEHLKNEPRKCDAAKLVRAGLAGLALDELLAE
mmetsp:Transcript_95388/g.309084  ORF Transcript_95388/g.309084 Transcript_95388/m.309084 type:complete len:153 (+) Transcript_95388:70-528(+)|eukprot:CAMPEP_0203905724 /NCGR_PEP_ID=MMETSP0359-20131031/47425_1 /ASSEMBLY_ACC=CAM_ASM_000338 /TAXON_ID=268821 /ORGANISM="Scrippsiella Hangoei, Strain SHTV-5" /LENGTH=152 /DNA_ID=CAMNT_0050830247 /DNA_START=51 /DNA_END=509 /DNA_ORIENTATION=-